MLLVADTYMSYGSITYISVTYTVSICLISIYFCNITHQQYANIQKFGENRDPSLRFSPNLMDVCVVSQYIPKQIMKDILKNYPM